MENENVVAVEQPSGLDRFVAVICQLSLVLKFGLIVPILLYYAVKRQEKPFLFSHVKQALFVQLSFVSVTVVYLIPALIMLGIVHGSGHPGLIGTILVIIMGIISLAYVLLFICILLCMLHAAFRAARGKEYTYPLYNKYVAWRERRKAKKE